MESQPPVSLDPSLHEHQFWEAVESTAWAPINVEDMKFLQGLLVENSDVVKPANLAAPIDYSIGRPICPPPAEVVSACKFSSDLELLLAERGSVDEVLQAALNDLFAKSRVAERQKYDRRQRRKSSVASTGPADDSEPVVGMVDGYCDLYSVTSAHEHTSEDADGIDSNALNLFACKMRCPPMHISGMKRGRRYDEIWDEEDFYGCIEQGDVFDSNGNKNNIISDWSQLIRNYNDDLDYPYSQWLSSAKKGLLVQPVKKIKGGHSKDVNELPASTTCSKLSVYFPSPPVPVSSHHPACWGPGWRKGFDEFSTIGSNGQKSINVSAIHPASVSTILIDRLTDQKHSLFDELEILWAVANSRHRVVADQNVEKLLQLYPKAFSVYQLASLSNWKKRLQNCLDSIVSEVMIPKSDRARVNGLGVTSIDVSYLNLKPAPEMFKLSSDEISAEEPLCDFSSDGKIKFSNRKFCSSPILMDKAQKKRINVHRIAMELTQGQIVEFLAQYITGVMPDPVWILGKVVKIFRDGEIMRYVKVRPLSSSSSVDNILIAVEDNRIAEPGTHIPARVVQMLCAHYQFFGEIS